MAIISLHVLVIICLVTATSAFDYRRGSDRSTEKSPPLHEGYSMHHNVKSGQIMKPTVAKLKADSSGVSHIEHPLPPTGISSRIIMAKISSIKSLQEKKIEDTILDVPESLEEHSMEITTRSVKDDAKNTLLKVLPKIDIGLITKQVNVDKEKKQTSMQEKKELVEDKTEMENDVKESASSQMANKEGLNQKDAAQELANSKNLTQEKESDVMKEKTISKMEEKDEVEQDLKEGVVDAFHHNIKGDRKEYFKRAVSKMSKETLADLHEALLQVLNEPESMHDEDVKVEDVKEDLKNAVHELEDKVDGRKKKALIELEHVLEDDTSKVAGDKPTANMKQDISKPEIVGDVISQELNKVISTTSTTTATPNSDKKADLGKDVRMEDTPTPKKALDIEENSDVELVPLHQGKISGSKEALTVGQEKSAQKVAATKEGEEVTMSSEGKSENESTDKADKDSSVETTLGDTKESVEPSSEANQNAKAEREKKEEAQKAMNNDAKVQIETDEVTSKTKEDATVESKEPGDDGTNEKMTEDSDSNSTQEKKEESIEQAVEIIGDLKGETKQSLGDNMQPEKTSTSREDVDSNSNPKSEEEKSLQPIENKGIIGFVNKISKLPKDWGINKEIAGRRCRRHNSNQHYLRGINYGRKMKRSIFAAHI